MRERAALIWHFGTPEVAEALTSASAIGVGIGLLWPDGLFQRYPAFFRPMEVLAPEPVWGLLYLLAGLFTGWSAVDGRREIRRRSTLLMACLWVFLIVMFAQSDPRALSVYLIAVEALSSAWAFFRLNSRNWSIDGNPSDEAPQDGRTLQ